MKQLLIILLGLLCLTSLFSEGFETWPPEGWTFEPATGAGAWAQNNGSSYGPGSSNIYEGSSAAMFHNYNYQSNVTGAMITNTLDLTTYTAPELTFFWWNNDNANNPATLKVYTQVAEQDWVLIETIETFNSGSTTWIESTHILSTEVTKIKLEAVSDYGMKNTYVDAFTFAEAPVGEPAVPNLVLPLNNAIEVDLTANLEWTIGSNTDSATLYIADNIDFTNATIITEAISPYSNILDNNFTCFWKVAAINNTSGIEVSSEVFNYRTIFGIAEVPYAENFDTTETFTMPVGWVAINVPDGTNLFTQVEVINSSYFSSPNALRLYNSSNPTGTYIASTPLIENNNARVIFSAKASSNATTLIVGTMTDATDSETFTELQTIELTNAYELYTIFLPSERTVQNISFKQGINQAYSYIYIDDVSVEEIPANVPEAPQLVSPTNNAENVVLNSSLEWTTGIYTDTETLYFADNAEFTDAVIITDTTSPYTPTLENNVEYFWKVVAINNTSAMETSSVIFSFTTTYGTATAPYTQGFEDTASYELPDGWLFFNDSGLFTNYIRVESYYANTGSKALKMYNYTNGDANYLAITPLIENSGNRVSFFTKTVGSNPVDLIVGTMTDPQDINSFTELETISLTTDYVEVMINLPVDRAVNHIAFKHANNGLYRSIYIDDVSIVAIPEGAIFDISPTEYAFGALPQNEDVDQVDFTISNSGASSDFITGISLLNSDKFEIISDITLPYALESGADVVIGVKPLTTIAGEFSTTLRVRRADPTNPLSTIDTDATITANIIDSAGDSHNDPFILSVAETIEANGSTTAFTTTYNFMSSQSVVYKLPLTTAKMLDISLEGTAWDTKLYVFNSFDQIDNATSYSDAWYYNDDESSAGTANPRKSVTRSSWSAMYPSLASPADYYIVVTGYGSHNGDYTMTINCADLPLPGSATTPTPATEAISQPTNLTLSWSNGINTISNDLWFGEAGSMALVQDNVAAITEYAVTNLNPDTTYEWKVIGRNSAGTTPAEDVVTWSFTTFNSAPDPVVYSAPIDGATDVSRTGNVTWQAASSADGYKFYLSTENTFAGVTPLDVTTLEVQLSAEYSTEYFWKVIPYNVLGDTDGEVAVWSFTTGNAAFPDADTIFDGTRVVNQGMPMEPYFGYSITQNIYLQSELNAADDMITEISYLYNNNYGWSETVLVYMGHTPSNEFATASSWISSDNLTLVYDGSITVDTIEPIINITLDTEFAYNNTDNLVVVFLATQQGYHGSNDEFYNYAVPENRSLTQRSDSAGYDVTLPPSSGYLKAYTPVTGFNFGPAPQVQPTTPTNVVITKTVDGLVITWDAVEGQTYKVYASATTEIDTTVEPIAHVNTGTYTYEGTEGKMFFSIKASHEALIRTRK